MIKKANTDYPIHELIENRWSPYKFLPDRKVPRKDLHLYNLMEER